MSDVDTTCGDGVLAQIKRGTQVLWQCSLPLTTFPFCNTFDVSTAVSAGEDLAFRVSPKNNTGCDTTYFPATITWDDGAGHDWTVSTQDGPRVLPPSGFFAEDQAGFRAYTARQGDATVDYVRASEYAFARSRAGAMTSVEEFLTDGGIAVVPGPWGDDLHGLDLGRADRSGELLLRSSVRADLNLRLLDARRALLTMRDPASGAAADVTWGHLPPAWRTILASHPGDLEWVPSDDDGNPQGATLPLAYDGNDPVFAGLDPDRPYLLRLTSECVGEGEDCAPSLACCAGRCMPEPFLTGVSRDGADVVLSWSGACSAGDTVLRSTDPADFGEAQAYPTTEASWRDVGAAEAPQSFFYLVR